MAVSAPTLGNRHGALITALDGLRAVALLIIMGYHFGVGWLKGGFFSLDIFYVLSGYLITGLLLGEYRKRSSIKLSAFWLRRARRLLPALPSSWSRSLSMCASLPRQTSIQTLY